MHVPRLRMVRISESSGSRFSHENSGSRNSGQWRRWRDDGLKFIFKKRPRRIVESDGNRRKGPQLTRTLVTDEVIVRGEFGLIYSRRYRLAIKLVFFNTTI